MAFAQSSDAKFVQNFSWNSVCLIWTELTPKFQMICTKSCSWLLIKFCRYSWTLFKLARAWCWTHWEPFCSLNRGEYSKNWVSVYKEGYQTSNLRVNIHNRANELHTMSQICSKLGTEIQNWTIAQNTEVDKTVKQYSRTNEEFWKLI